MASICDQEQHKWSGWDHLCRDTWSGLTAYVPGPSISLHDTMLWLAVLTCLALMMRISGCGSTRNDPPESWISLFHPQFHDSIDREKLHQLIIILLQEFVENTASDLVLLSGEMVFQITDCTTTKIIVFSQ